MDQEIKSAPSTVDDGAHAGDIEQVAWHCIEVRSAQDLDALAKRIEPLARLDPLAGHERNLAWLSVESRDTEVDLLVFLLELGDIVLGYAPVAIIPAATWDLEVGSHTLWQVPVDRFHCKAGVFLDPRLRDASDELVLGWLNLLRARCRGRKLVAFNSVFANSPFMAAIKSAALRAAGYRLLPHAPASVRRILTLPPTFDDYLKSLGRNTRQTLSRRHRKLAKEHEVTLDIATEPAHVDKVFEDSVMVSKKTYQWREEIGLNATDRTHRCMVSAALEGRLRWYLLRCDGEPVAFMSGYLDRDRFIWPDLGFDPAWSDKAVGLVLQYLVIKDLIETMPSISLYDCGPMDTENKRRLVKGGGKRVPPVSRADDVVWYRALVFGPDPGMGRVALEEGFVRCRGRARRALQLAMASLSPRDPYSIGAEGRRRRHQVWSGCAVNRTALRVGGRFDDQTEKRRLGGAVRRLGVARSSSSSASSPGAVGSIAVPSSGISGADIAKTPSWRAIVARRSLR